MFETCEATVIRKGKHNKIHRGIINSWKEVQGKKNFVKYLEVFGLEFLIKWIY